LAHGGALSAAGNGNGRGQRMKVEAVMREREGGDEEREEEIRNGRDDGLRFYLAHDYRRIYRQLNPTITFFVYPKHRISLNRVTVGFIGR